MNVGAESQIAGIWRRLRERKVAQWGIAYVAGAWGFLQGLGYVSDTFGWPGHIRQLVTLALLIGLPLLLVLAWYHGDRGQQRVSGAELTIITLLFLLGGGIFWQYARDKYRAQLPMPPARRNPRPWPQMRPSPCCPSWT